MHIAYGSVSSWLRAVGTHPLGTTRVPSCRLGKPGCLVLLILAGIRSRKDSRAVPLPLTHFRGSGVAGIPSLRSTGESHINSSIRRLLQRRDAASAELEAILKGRTSVTPHEERICTEKLALIEQLDERIIEEKRRGQRANQLAEARRAVTGGVAVSDARVVDEKPVYGKNSEHSYIADRIAITMLPGMDQRAQSAAGRLTEWSHQVEREIHLDTKKGRRYIEQVRNEFRESGNVRGILDEVRTRGSVEMGAKEVRAIGSGGGASASAGGGGGAAFVAPVIFLQKYAPYREAGRAFVDQCNGQPLPDYGMNVYIPQITGPAGVRTQSEGTGVNETDPTMGFLTGALITKAGQVTLSQQVLDRAGPGFNYDSMIFDQLNRDLAPQVDTYVLTQALANATSQNWSGNAGAFVLAVTSGSGGFYGQVSKAKASVRTAAGTFLNPTHLFLQPTRWEYMASWADSQGRPIVVPDYAGPFNAAAGGSSDGDSGIEGYTGYKFNGLRAFADANIPTVGTAASEQAVVGCLSEVYVFEGTPVLRVVPQTLAGNLQVLLQLYEYVTAIVRYPSGIVSINGTGLSPISYTT